MSIMFKPKIIRKIFLPCSLAVSAAASHNNDTQIKEMSKDEFEMMKSNIDTKKARLSKINREILKYIPINKNNIQCLNVLMDNNKDFYKYYSCLSFDNINSAKFFLYELQNKREIEDKLGGSFIQSDIHKLIETEEDLEFKTKLLEYGLKNSAIGSSVHFTDVIKKSSCLEEALSMLEHAKNYGILPDARKSFYSLYGKDKTDKMLESINECNNKYNLNIDYIDRYANTYRENFNILRNRSDIIFRFDPDTGVMVTFEKDNCIYNFNNKTTTKIIPTSIKEDKAAFLDSRKLLGAGFEIRNFNGDLIATRKFRRSRFKGEFELEETTSNGKTYKLGLTEKDKKGGKHVEKHFTSFDGTITDYVYALDRKGNNYSYYKITDSENNVLYETQKKFKVLSDSHFKSEVNGIMYDILIDNDKISVKKLDGSGDIVEYKIKKYSDNDYVRMENFLAFCDSENLIKSQLNNKQTTAGELAVSKGIIEEKNTVDKNLLKIIKKLSGDEWFAINNAKVYTIRAAKDKNIAHSIGNAIEIGSNNQFFAVLEHELGHEKARALDLENDPKFKRLYEYEKNLFTTNFPDLAVEQAGYFLRELMANPIGETIAESNLIVNGEQDWNNIGSRTLFLQQYFPRTIAYVANKYRELV